MKETNKVLQPDFVPLIDTRKPKRARQEAHPEREYEGANCGIASQNFPEFGNRVVFVGDDARMRFLSISEGDRVEEGRPTDDVPCSRCEIESPKGGRIVDGMFHNENEELDREFT